MGNILPGPAHSFQKKLYIKFRVQLGTPRFFTFGYYSQEYL